MFRLLKTRTRGRLNQWMGFLSLFFFVGLAGADSLPTNVHDRLALLDHFTVTAKNPDGYEDTGGDVDKFTENCHIVSRMPDQWITEVICNSGTSPDLIALLRSEPEIAAVEPVLEGGIWLTGQVFVRLLEGASTSEFESKVSQLGALEENYSHLLPDLYLVTLPLIREENSVEVSSGFNQLATVSWSEPNIVVEGASTPPNDPHFAEQWALRNISNAPGGHPGTFDADMDVYEPSAGDAWGVTVGDTIKIAILDTGVELDHEDLQGQLLPGADCIDLSVDPNDPHPLGGCSFDQDPGNADCTPGDNGDFGGHGTSVAGIVAASYNNGLGVSGMAHGADLIPVRILSQSYLNGGGVYDVRTTSQFMANAIKWAWENAQADVINYSGGTQVTSQLVADAIEDAYLNGRGGRGTVMVFSSGNWGSQNPDDIVDFPARHPLTLAVGASSQCDEVKRGNYQCGAFPCLTSCDGLTSWGSVYGPELSLVAPGTNIFTTDQTDLSSNPLDQCGFGDGKYISHFVGTSASAPYVSSLAAMILALDGDLPPDAVRGFMKAHTEPVQVSVNGSWLTQATGQWSEQAGWGRINANDSLTAVNGRNKNLVWVDAANSHTEMIDGVLTELPNRVIETGTSSNEGFNTLQEGVLAVQTGGTININAGAYTTSQSLTKAMTLTANGGIVTITGD